VDLESVVEQEKGKFTLTEVLHIPDARCNLISGVRLDLKGAWTTTGDQKLAVYMGSEKKPFMVGRISNGLYRLDVKPITQPDSALNLIPSPPLINPMAGDPGSSVANSVPPFSARPSVNLAGSSMPTADPTSLPDPGIFAVPSLISIYQQPSEEDNLKFFSTV
jgi:hypothetical protein